MTHPNKNIFLLAVALLIGTACYSFVSLGNVNAQPNQQLEPQTLLLIRHFEKVKQGIDPELSALGEKQAALMVDVAINYDVKRIFSTDYKRTMQSALPSALAIGQSIINYEPTDWDTLLRHIERNQSNTMIVGHSNTIPALIDKLSGEKIVIDESDYGTVYVLERLQNSLLKSPFQLRAITVLE